MRRLRSRSEGADKSVLEQLQQQEIFLPADCGGRGACGKCRIRFLSEPPAVTEQEEKALTPEQLADGWRLACESYVTGEYEILLDQSEDEMIAAAAFHGTEQEPADPCAGQTAEPGAAVQQTGAKIVKKGAVDIGTTTIAMSLVDCTNRRVLDTRTSVNHQRSYGADVISRIKASTDGKKEELQKSIRTDLQRLVRQLGEDPDTLELVVAGNTTMEHLLLGLPCDTLGVAPYTPVDISLHQEGNLLIMPGISTYVGADIVSGIVACGMDQSEEICILVDLGTNGEMAIGNRDRILVASTAAGPAFEGGNIQCGVAGIPGAVSAVEIRDGKTSIRTIGDRPPVGLCGTGVLETVYELLKEGLVDETGLLDEAYEEQGFPLAEGIVLTAKDIREVQLAKSAIRAGIETLVRTWDISYDRIGKLYLAGGFGQKINLEKAAGIGMLPKELLDRTAAVGNSSLAGAVLLAEDDGLRARFARAASGAEEVALSESPYFGDLYMEYMFFDPECREEE